MTGDDAAALPLVGTVWQLLSIEGDLVEVDPTPTLVFDGDGRVSGTAGVNRIMGDYEVAAPSTGGEEGDGVLRVGDLATTRMAGPEEAMVLERQFLTALGGGGRYAVDGDVLTVGVLAFVGQPPAADPGA